MRKIIKLIMICTSTLIAVACDNKEMEQLLREYYPESTSAYENNHVLMIIVDGASGSAIQQAVNDGKAPSLKNLRETSTYTFSGLAETSEKISASTKISNERGWANLMTGVSTHEVGITGGKTLHELEAPSFMDLWLQKKKDAKISLYAADATFYQAFKREGMKAPVLTNDFNVQENLLNELKSTETSVSQLIIVEFKGVQDAGEEAGFYAGNNSTPEVMDAVKVLDGYIETALSTLRQRPKFKNENWLVLLTSNYGGEVAGALNTSNRYENATARTFVIINNLNLAKNVQIAPSAATVKYNYSTPKWAFDKANWGTGYASLMGYTERAVLQDPTLFPMDDGGNWGKSYTIQFLLRVNGTTSIKAPVISKRKILNAGTSSVGTNAGWSILLNNATFPGVYADDYSKARGPMRGPTVLNDYDWHLVSLTFEPRTGSNKDFFQIYVDGVIGTNGPNLTSNFRACWSYDGTPLTICGAECASSYAPAFIRNAWFEMTNIQIYDTVIPQADMIEYGGRPWLEKMNDYKYADNLIAYWPCDREEDYGKSRLKDYSKYAPGDGSTDFIIEGMPCYVSGISEASNIVKPPLESDATFYHQCYNSVDLPYEVLQWLGCTMDKNWKLEGQGWVLKKTGVNE